MRGKYFIREYLDNYPDGNKKLLYKVLGELSLDPYFRDCGSLEGFQLRSTLANSNQKGNIFDALFKYYCWPPSDHQPDFQESRSICWPRTYTTVLIDRPAGRLAQARQRRWALDLQVLLPASSGGLFNVPTRSKTEGVVADAGIVVIGVASFDD